MGMESFDLRALLSRFGGEVFAGVTSAPADRDEIKTEVKMLDSESAPVVADMPTVCCFIDGIQSSVTLGWRESRPVALHYAGAGAANRGELLSIAEELSLVCAAEDEEWVTAESGGVPVLVVEDGSPTDVSRNVAAELGGMRERLERGLCEQILKDTTEGLVMCDGSIVGRDRNDRVVGVVKTTQSRYLADESVLWRLPKGWRSPRFVIPGAGATSVDRHSCYVRLQDARRRPWDFGLIRVETWSEYALMSVAKLALEDSQDGSRQDSRWDRHLRSVRNVEDLMRARRPALF